MKPSQRIFQVAAVQAAPAFLDLRRSVAEVCRLIGEAGRLGARLTVFPEAFVPTYPFWVWLIPAGKTKVLRELYAQLVQNAMTIDGSELREIQNAARRAKTNVVLGVNECNTEASSATLFNSLLFISDMGELLGRHRKLVPTVGERMVHGRGDGSSLCTYDMSIGRVGGLICWENYMPLARYALYAAGIQIYVAPTWDRGEPWLSTLRHIGKESRAFVIGCCSAVRKDDIVDPTGLLEEFLPDAEWINPGGSAIVDPDGKFLAEPVFERSEILTAEVNAEAFSGPRYQLDVAGHYARPDVFRLSVNRSVQPIIEPRVTPFEPVPDARPLLREED